MGPVDARVRERKGGRDGTHSGRLLRYVAIFPSRCATLSFP